MGKRDWERKKPNQRFRSQLKPWVIEVQVFWGRVPQALGTRPHCRRGAQASRAKLHLLLPVAHVTTEPSPPSRPGHGKTVFHETGPWCQEGWGPLFQGILRDGIKHNSDLPKRFNAYISCPSLVEDFFQGHSLSGTSSLPCPWLETSPRCSQSAAFRG